MKLIETINVDNGILNRQEREFLYHFTGISNDKRYFFHCKCVFDHLFKPIRYESCIRVISFETFEIVRRINSQNSQVCKFTFSELLCLKTLV